ncbi:MAG: hypothetical protein KUG77_00480, partial [Nannocystaceae bacterium]|nr:hypothetical protein [Nannocystaceae bacterium]
CIRDRLRGVLHKAQARLDAIEKDAPEPKDEGDDPTAPQRAKVLSQLHELEREIGSIRGQLDAIR